MRDADSATRSNWAKARLLSDGLRNLQMTVGDCDIREGVFDDFLPHLPLDFAASIAYSPPFTGGVQAEVDISRGHGQRTRPPHVTSNTDGR